MIEWFNLPTMIGIVLVIWVLIALYQRRKRIRFGQSHLDQRASNGDSILEAVRFAATEFLKADHWDQAIERVLIRLHTATQATRINLFQRVRLQDDTYVSEYRFGYPFETDEEKALIHTIQTSEVRTEDLNRLLSGEMIILTPAQMSGNLLELVKQRDSKTILIMPIMIAGAAWGVLSLTSDDERAWQISEREALHAAADILGAAIQRQHDAEALFKREKILEAVSFASRQFLRSGNWEHHIQRVLEQLGTATKVSRVYIFSIEIDENDEDLATLRFSWTAEGITNQIDNPNLRGYPLSKQLPRIYQQLRQREVVYGVVKEMPEEDRQGFRTTDILSVLIVPIIVANRFWGVIGFDECTYPRKWSSSEREALKAAAEIIGGGIQRDEQEQILRENTSQLSERNQDLEAFNHTIAHDLRSPLHSITNALKMLRQRYVTELSEEAMETLVSIEIRSKQLNEMIDQLWWLTRLHDPSQEITPVEMDLAIHSALVRYTDRVTDRGISVIVGDHVPLAIGHWRWVVEVFANLISNAIKFVDESKPNPTIEITGIRIGDSVCFSVRDNGIGISIENQQIIFEMFERLDKSRSTGSGLGLALVKRMVTKMDGEVGVESTIGEGTRFWFTLPACPPSYLVE